MCTVKLCVQVLHTVKFASVQDVQDVMCTRRTRRYVYKTYKALCVQDVQDVMCTRRTRRYVYKTCKTLCVQDVQDVMCTRRYVYKTYKTLCLTYASVQDVMCTSLHTVKFAEKKNDFGSKTGLPLSLRAILLGSLLPRPYSIKNGVFGRGARFSLKWTLYVRFFLYKMKTLVFLKSGDKNLIFFCRGV